MSGWERRRLLAMLARIEGDRTGADPFAVLLRLLARDGYDESQLDRLATEAFLTLTPVDEEVSEVPLP